MLHEPDTGVEVLLVILVWNFYNLVNWTDFPLFLETEFLNNVPAVFSKVLFTEQFQQSAEVLIPILGVGDSMPTKEFFNHHSKRVPCIGLPLSSFHHLLSPLNLCKVETEVPEVGLNHHGGPGAGVVGFDWHVMWGANGNVHSNPRWLNLNLRIVHHGNQDE